MTSKTKTAWRCLFCFLIEVEVGGDEAEVVQVANK